MAAVFHVIRLTIVAICLLLGVAGLLLPILPGWIFFGVAALILFPDAALAHRAMAAIDKRWPRVARALHRLQGRERTDVST